MRLFQRKKSTEPVDRGDPAERALAEASKLADAGKPIEAVRVLTDANRTLRDRGIERRLARLRFEAFQKTKWSNQRPEQPAAFDDAFPDQLIPEVAAADLDVDTLRSAVTNHGSLIVRGLIGQDEVDRLVGAIDRAYDAFDAKEKGESDGVLDGWYEPFEHKMITDEDRKRKRQRGNMLAIESPPAFFELTEILNEAGIGKLAEEHFGEPPMVLARKVTLRRLPPHFTGAWHQDGAFMGRDIRAINVWIALTHCGDNAPGLDIVGRRVDEIVETGNGASKPWSVKPEDAEQTGGNAVVRPIFDAGDAILFDQLCLHRTGTDKGMTVTRHAIEIWFFAPSTYDSMITPIDDGYSPRDQVPLVY